MTISLDQAMSVMQLVAVAIVLPSAGFKMWRKLDERLTAQDMRLVRIEYQLYENGGQSMKDQVNRLVTDVAVLKATQKKSKAEV
jgi:hypothetical protein